VIENLVQASGDRIGLDIIGAGRRRVADRGGGQRREHNRQRAQSQFLLHD
jgi:hypothetical protein